MAKKAPTKTSHPSLDNWSRPLRQAYLRANTPEKKKAALAKAVAANYGNAKSSAKKSTPAKAKPEKRGKVTANNGFSRRLAAAASGKPATKKAAPAKAKPAKKSAPKVAAKKSTRVSSAKGKAGGKGTGGGNG